MRALESDFHYLCYSHPEFGYPLNLSIWVKYQALPYYWLLNGTVHWFNWRILIKNWCDNVPYCPQSAHKASTDVRWQSYSHSYSTAVRLVLGKIAAHAFRDNSNSNKQIQRPFLLWGRKQILCAVFTSYENCSYVFGEDFWFKHLSQEQKMLLHRTICLGWIIFPCISDDVIEETEVDFCRKVWDYLRRMYKSQYKTHVSCCFCWACTFSASVLSCSGSFPLAER